MSEQMSGCKEREDRRTDCMRRWMKGRLRGRPTCARAFWVLLLL